MIGSRGSKKVAGTVHGFDDLSKAEMATSKQETERLNFNVSPSVAAETRQLASDLNISMTQLFRYSLSIFKIAVEEGRKQRKLVIADKNGKALREFVLPGLD